MNCVRKSLFHMSRVPAVFINYMNCVPTILYNCMNCVPTVLKNCMNIEFVKIYQKLKKNNDVENVFIW